MTDPDRTVPHATVIGDPIALSKSPMIHGFWIARLGIDATYRAERVEPERLRRYIDARRINTAWRGCNVTMPHKQSVARLCSTLDPLAKKIGAVNTLVKQEDGVRGYNTDVAGFLEPLRDTLRMNHLYRMARIIGTGGAARAVTAALLDHNFTIVMAGRDPAKARAILDTLDPHGEHHTPPLSHFATSTDFAFDDRVGCLDLVVNTSPLGMTGQPELSFDMSHVPPGSIVYDIVTDPVRTPFLQAAEAAGFETVDGLAMLVGQAAAAFELFFGVQPPREHDGELRTLLTA
ncbi:MAG: shikimate dehydrogenase [Pontixanthobacter sp.]